MHPVWLNRTWQTCKWLTMASFNDIYNKKSLKVSWGPLLHHCCSCTNDHFRREITIKYTKVSAFSKKADWNAHRRQELPTQMINPDDSSSLNRNLQSGNIIVITWSIKDTHDSGIKNTDLINYPYHELSNNRVNRCKQNQCSSYYEKK